MRSNQLIALFVAIFAIFFVNKSYAYEEIDSSDVIKINSNNIYDILDEYKNSSSILLKYYSPRCGHCRNMEGDFMEAATMLRGQIAFGEINCLEDKKLCQQIGVNGFPTLIYVKNGLYGVYDRGDRSVDGLISATMLTETTTPLPYQRPFLPPEYQQHYDELVHDLSEIWSIRRNALGVIVSLSIFVGIILANIFCVRTKIVSAPVKTKSD